MSMRRAMLTGLAGGLIAALLSGCIFDLAPVQFVPRQAFASVSEVALAVGANGYKHYAWSECSGQGAQYTCVLIYVRSASGGVLYSYGIVQPIGTFVQSPDVAVSSNGDAYVVRSVCSAPFTCVDYWSVYPANPDGVLIETHLLHTSALQSQGPPRVEARGSNVYASYYVTTSDQVRLHYRQLSGGSRSGLIDGSGLSPTDVSLAVDAGGDLHAAWVRNPITDTIVAYSNNQGGVSNFNAPTLFDNGDNLLITHPDLALDGAGRAYLAYSINSGSNDIIHVRCLDSAANCYRGVTLLTVPQVDGGWNVYREVDLEMTGAQGQQPNVVFAATHNSLSFTKVWWYRPPSSGGDDPPTRVTQTTFVNEGAPRIVKEHSTAGDIPVIGWRTFQDPPPAEANSPAGSPEACYGDVYMLYYSTTEIQRVFADQGTCANGAADLASNGAWVAGVWTDRQSNQIAAHAAWTIFNTYRVNLPAVRR